MKTKRGMPKVAVSLAKGNADKPLETFQRAMELYPTVYQKIAKTVFDFESIR
ncbi:hypothetical protein H6F77_07065 [Microcoleus sp. FACHB-831]|uniref:hypothetical protein n=1 Tax=Microcoleus sp. FACHB-831 TaxID=2692827 RepID=UPI00198D57AC|nr:hypothetical protein [Microcoleus sp. FACHB-831]MBD1920845.1 hypothetical protein [Microcoleus sp. FACHB-831]